MNPSQNTSSGATPDDAQPEGQIADFAAKPLRSIWKWGVAAVIVALLAFPVFLRLRDTNAKSAAEAQLTRSLEAYQAGQYQEAIKAAQAALRLKPDYAFAYNNLAVSYLGLHMYDEAIHNAQEALRVQPDFELAKNNLAWIQREKTKAAGVPAAPPPGPPAAPLKPGTAEFYMDQSFRSYSAEKFQASIDAAQQALKLSAHMATAYNNIAASYASLGMWDKAIENAQKALQIQPDLELARNNLNWALNGKAAAFRNKKK